VRLPDHDGPSNPLPEDAVKVRVIKSPWALVFVLSISFSASVDAADPAPPTVTTKVLTTTTTSSGQPIALPRSDVEVIVTTLEIQPHANLPRHLHPYPRYGYVLEGTLKITNDQAGTTQVFNAGDFIVEAIGQWHRAETIGDAPVKLLVIDQVEGGKLANSVVQK
jgi:quercetin dioxygenase-like cupin family protein